MLKITTEVTKTFIKDFSTVQLFNWRLWDLFQVQDLSDAKVKIKNQASLISSLLFCQASETYLTFHE